MAVNPICQVREGAGPWVATTNGVDVTPGATISIKLADVTDVTDWYLQVTGTDETTTPPTLTDVNPITNKVTAPTSIVTFTMPAGTGRALLFSSLVTGTGGPLSTTFSIYALTDHSRRVGSAGEQREGDSSYGWASIVNPLIRTGAGVLYYNDAATSPSWGVDNVQDALDYLKAGGGFSAGGDLTGSGTSQTVSYIRGVISPDPILALHGKDTRVVEDYSPDLYSPYAAVSDGTYLYVGVYNYMESWGWWGNGIVHKLRPLGDGSTLEVVAKVDLAATLPEIVHITGLAADSTYLYAVTPDTENIAIINKATMAVVGWGWMGSGMFPSSVCADGAGNFYCYGTDGGNYIVGKFSTAACLGQPPGTVTYSSSYVAPGTLNQISFGGGYVWAVDYGSGAGTQKIDPATMTLVISDSGATAGMESFYAFGSLWVIEGTSPTPPARISRLDPTTLALQATVTLPTSMVYGVSHLAFGPDSSGTPNARLYASSESYPYIGIINPLTNAFEAVFAPGGTEHAGVAAIGNVVYAMAYVSNPQDRPNGIFFVDYPMGTAGQCVYKPRLEYQSQGKDDLGYIGWAHGESGYPQGKIGQVPSIRDQRAEPVDMAYDFYADPAIEQIGRIWIVRSRPNDVIVWDVDTDAFGYTIPLAYAGDSFAPHTILISPKYVWVSGTRGHIVKIDRVTRDVLDYRLKVPTDAYAVEGLAWDDTHGCVLTTVGGSDEFGIIYSLDATTHRFTQHDLSASINEYGRGIIVVGTDAFFFGTANLWKIDLTTWTVTATAAIPNPNAGRIRSKYEAGYIWFISQWGTDLARVDPATTTVSSITVGTDTMGLCYDGDDDIVAVTMSGTTVIQYVTTPTGVMALGSSIPAAVPLTMGGIVYDSSWSYLYFTLERLSPPYHAVLNSTWYGWSGTIPDPDTGPTVDAWLNGTLEWVDASGFTAGGDLTGSSSSQTVVGLRGRAITSTTPTTGQVYYYTGSQWAPGTLASDVTGSFTSNTVARLRGRTISTTAPTNGQVYAWNTGLSQWVPSTPGGLPTATLAEDLVTWDGTAWVAKQPPAGIVNFVAGESLLSNGIVVWDRDRTGATTNYYAYRTRMTAPFAWGWTTEDDNSYTIAAAWRTGSFLDGQYLYDAAALGNLAVVVAWYESNAINLRAVTTPYNTTARTWSVAAGAGLTSISTAGACTDVCVVALSTTKFVVGWIYSGSIYLCACTYVSPASGFTYGTPVQVQDGVGTVTNAISIALEKGPFSYASDDATTDLYFAYAFGRSTNLGYIHTGRILSGTDTIVLASTVELTTATPFGSATCPPVCITLKSLGDQSVHPGTSSVVYGVLYGDTARAVDTYHFWFQWERAFGYDQVQLSGYWRLGTSGSVWRIDEDMDSTGPYYLLDGATANPGFGDFLGKKWVSVFRATHASFNTRMVLASGTVPFPGSTPCPNRPKILPYNTSTQWGVSSITITALDHETFAWGGRLTVAPAEAGWSGKVPIGVGTGTYKDGVVSFNLGSHINKASGTIYGNYFVPTTANARQRFKTVKLSNNRFMLIFSGRTNPATPSDVSMAYHCFVSEQPYVAGVMQEAATIGQTKRCAIYGGISRSATGLIPGAYYYWSTGDYTSEFEFGRASDATSILLTLGREMNRRSR